MDHSGCCVAKRLERPLRQGWETRQNAFIRASVRDDGTRGGCGRDVEEVKWAVPGDGLDDVEVRERDISRMATRFLAHAMACNLVQWGRL